MHLKQLAAWRENDLLFSIMYFLADLNLNIVFFISCAGILILILIFSFCFLLLLFVFHFCHPLICSFQSLQSHPVSFFAFTVIPHIL